MHKRRVFIGAALGAAAFGLAGRLAHGQQGAGDRRRHILVLDVIETMLDIKALEPLFARAFGDGRVLQEWFANLLLYANVETVAGPYADFAATAGVVLDMTASVHGRTLSSSDRTAILQGTLSLPAHPDVKDGLQRLKEAGFRMVTLTNSSPGSVTQQLRNAGLTDFFERAFSVDAVKKYKPAAETYQYVAREMGVATSGLRMIAAHAWDVHGALRAGCAAAFLARPGHALFPAGPVPDIVAPDLRAAAARIIAAEPR
jgi:2-haloacid dehalogenase